MKRFLPLAIVALLVLVPAGVVLAAKSVKQATTTKVAHRSAKQKAANEKLIQELLTIMEETENKMTFAACVVSLTQLKPEREVVVPAIIRKADKMGWLRNDGDDCAMIAEFLMQFLSAKHRRATREQQYNNYAYNAPCPCPCPMPVPPPPGFIPPPGPIAPSPYASYPMPQPMCPPSCPAGSYCPAPMPCPPPPAPPTGASTWRAAPASGCEVGTSIGAAIGALTGNAMNDKMTVELLKILEETDSKVTFALVVEALDERCDNWDVVIPMIIRKADKMGWMKPPDKDFGDKFTQNLAEFVGSKVKAQKSAPACGTAPISSCPADCPPPVAGTLSSTGITGSITFDVPEASCPRTERLPMPRRSVDVAPMPRAPEVLPMPHTEDQHLLFDFGFGWPSN
jgi:hypothetical protein